MNLDKRDFKVVIAKEKIREYMQVPVEAKLRFLEELLLLKSQINTRKKEKKGD